MKMPLTADDPAGLINAHAAFLLDSGYSSFVLCTKHPGEDNLLAPMEEGKLWGSACVQLTEAAVYFGLGSDAVDQAIWIYLDGGGKTDPPQRSLTATFSSQGEQVYLECLIDMTCGDSCDQFFLPVGDYKVQFLSWNLDQAHDNFDADPAFYLVYAHHELRFTTKAGVTA